MDWVKRNLFFVIGAAIALILLVGAGFYTWTGYQHNSEKSAKLDESYASLKRLTDNQFIGGSGSGDKVDNIGAAKEQVKEIRAFLGKTTRQFQRVAAIPSSEKIGRDEYASVLRLTIDQLQREATNNSVMLPPRYSFSFEAQRQRTDFGNIPQLAVQLGEVKAICEILNKAKVNMIEGIRRERVSADDEQGPAADYVTTHSTTNELAILSPYEVTFRSFSPELGAVLAGFANSPHAMIVKSINVEAAAQTAPDPTSMQPPQPTVVYQQPVPLRPPPTPQGDADARYGKGYNPEFRQQPPVQPQVYNVPTAPKGMPVMLNEKQLKVTLLVMVVKLLPPVKK